jgi:2-keto-4-pentenoate hydratase/2-oxohepta-3-ene-1,7-dioic acid hydratase in catechol pathway
MKILRFNDERIGVLADVDQVVDVSEAIDHRVEKGPQQVIEEVIERFDDLRPTFESIVVRGNGVPLSTVKLLVPVPRPSKCLAAFSNYLDTPDRKVEDVIIEFFYKSSDLLGPEGTVQLPDLPVLVYQPEAEIAFVMGKHAHDVDEAQALDYVFGYVPFVDISARGMTRRSQLLPKGQDTFGPCGPWITTKDEVPDPHNIQVRSWVNGEARQDYSTSFMAHKIPAQVAWLSRFMNLRPGDIITTGTYHVGLGPLNEGDVLEIEIERLGRARYYTHGHGPRHDVEFRPGVTKMPPAPEGMTRV